MTEINTLLAIIVNVVTTNAVLSSHSIFTVKKRNFKIFFSDFLVLHKVYFDFDGSLGKLSSLETLLFAISNICK